MPRRRPRPIRTTIDLADPTQVRLLRKHLGITDADLVRIVGKIGTSLAAIGKEVQLEKVRATEQP